MKNFLVLTGFLIGIMAGVVVVGEQVIVAYENAINAGIASELTALRLAEVRGEKEIEIAKTANLFFVGDIMLSRAVEEKTAKSGDYRFPFLKAADYLKTGDIVFGNLEGPISNGGQNQGSQFSFRADPKMVEGLVYSGFNILSLANNHIWDYGASALTDTLKILRNNNITSAGAGENEAVANEMAVKEINGSKIGLLAYSNLYSDYFEAGQNLAGISNFDLEKVSQKIRDIRNSKLVDIVVVSIHWGDEYAEKSSEQQQKIARQLIDSGVDLIVGHHSHVAQDFEYYKNRLIVYGLGNFIFDQNFSDQTMSGYLLRVKTLAGKLNEWEVKEVKINSDYQAEIGESVSGVRKFNI